MVWGTIDSNGPGALVTIKGTIDGVKKHILPIADDLKVFHHDNALPRKTSTVIRALDHASFDIFD